MRFQMCLFRRFDFSFSFTQTCVCAVARARARSFDRAVYNKFGVMRLAIF